ncbi:hypothetical protein Tco_0133524 [Tanacetum coccineum]
MPPSSFLHEGNGIDALGIGVSTGETFWLRDLITRLNLNIQGESMPETILLDSATSDEIAGVEDLVLILATTALFLD